MYTLTVFASYIPQDFNCFNVLTCFLFCVFVFQGVITLLQQVDKETQSQHMLTVFARDNPGDSEDSRTGSTTVSYLWKENSYMHMFMKICQADLKVVILLN